MMKKLLPFMAMVCCAIFLNAQTLSRSVVAIPGNKGGVFVSWRLFETDPEGTGFNVYRSNENEDRELLNNSPIKWGTNFVDETADLSKSNAYSIVPVSPEGEELTSENARTTGTSAVAATQANVITVNLRSGNFIHFCWVGDLDGDGDNDFVVDRLGDGSSLPDKIEAYTNDGTFMWELNYGPNSLNRDRFNPGSSAIDVGHWDGVTVGDVNGDGKAEVITKIANGVTLGDGQVWTHSDDRRQWIVVLDGATGSRIRYSEVPQDYISVGPMAAQMGVGNDNEVFVHMKNRNSDGSFNQMNLCYQMQNSLTLKWKKNSTGATGHQFRIVDVNQDGVDDMVHIGYALNGHNGNTLYTLSGIVHGDRFQIGKFDPDRPGLQGYGIQQENPSGLVEYYYDATTGQVLWQNIVGVYDNGRGNAADIDPRYPGYEMWSFNGVYNAPTQTKLTNDPDRPWPNFRLWWDGDNGSELYDNGKIERWNYETNSTERLVTTSQYGGAGSWRGAPLFYGDIMGDWREEVVLKSSANDKLVIFTTDIPTNISRPPLTTDRYYRNCLSLKGYMQSHYTSYYLGEGNSGGPASYYQLQNRSTGLFLDGLGRTTNGDACGQYANTTHINSHWSVQQYDGTYYRIQNRSTGLYLDGLGRTANAANCGQWANTTSSNAQWQLVPVSSGSRLDEALSGEAPPKITIHPNPATDDFTIVLPSTYSGETNATIYDGMGRVVISSTFNSSKHTIQAAKLPVGIYILEITNNNEKLIVEKLIKK